MINVLLSLRFNDDDKMPPYTFHTECKDGTEVLLMLADALPVLNTACRLHDVDARPLNPELERAVEAFKRLAYADMEGITDDELTPPHGASYEGYMEWLERRREALT